MDCSYKYQTMSKIIVLSLAIPKLMKKEYYIEVWDLSPLVIPIITGVGSTTSMANG